MTERTTRAARRPDLIAAAYGYRIVARHSTVGPERAAELILGYARAMTGHPL